MTSTSQNFASQSWSNRFAVMGDQAEAKWIEVAHEYLGTSTNGTAPSVQVGLSRPPFDVRPLPMDVRYLPDFLTPLGWVECQGVGRDQTLKLKLEKLFDMAHRNRTFPVQLFVWDSHKKRHTMISTDRLLRIVDEGKAELGYFPEPKAFFGVGCEHIFGEQPKAKRRSRKRPLIRCKVRRPNVSDSWTPTQDFAGGDDSGTPLGRQHLPETETEALMQCAPFETPKPTKAFMAEVDTKRRNLLMEAINQLTPVERVVVLHHTYEGSGPHTLQDELRRLREAGLYDGPVAHSHLHRIYLGALDQLKNLIQIESP